MTDHITARRRVSQASLLATASLAAMLLGAATTANAQTTPAPAEAVEEVVVTGIRQSLQSAVAMKKNTMEVVDSIRAEDIGKLPDPNVAETLTRIPGVQGYRYGGEGASPVGAGSGLTIRGLSGQTASQVDGRAYFTAGGREFNIESAIPGMIAGLDVYKNPSAEHIEGGIGGLVDVRTRRPLDLKGLTIGAAVTARYNDLAKSVQPEYFGLIANRWDVGDGEMGLLIGANYQKSFNRSDSGPGNGGPEWRRAARADSADCSAANLGAAHRPVYATRTDLNCLISVSDAQALAMPLADRQNLISLASVQTNSFQEDIRRTRKGLNAAFQWKPKPNLEFYVDGNYNYYLYHQNYRFLFAADSRYVQNLQTTPFTITEDLYNRNLNGGENALMSGQRFVSGTFVGSTVSSTGGDEHRPYTTYVLATGSKWSPTERLDLHFDIAYVKADQTQDNRSVSMVPRLGPTMTWDITRRMGEPQQVAYAGPDLASAGTWVFDRYNNNPHQVWKDTGLALAFDGKYHLDQGIIENLKFGVRQATQKSKYSNFGYGGRWLTTNGAALAADHSNAIFATGMQDLVSGSPTNWLGGEAGYGGGYLVFNPDSLLGDNVRNRFPLAGIPADGSIPEVLQSRRLATEATLAVYGVADFAFLDDRVRGNAGVRVIRTDLSAEAWVNDTSGSVPTVVPRKSDTEYTDVLPTFNITGYITPDTLLRFGYGKGLTRAAAADLNPSISVTQATGMGNQGNPNLKPLRADSYDLSFEQYFSSTSYVSAALFYKSIDGFFLGANECMTVPTAPPPAATANNSCPAGQYLISRNVNAESGTAKGVELAFQSFLDFLPGPLENFGVQGSYTYVKTELPIILANGQRIVARQPFQSDHNWSLAGLYESERLSARLVYTYRSDYVLFGVDRFPIWGRYLKGYGILDASVNVNLRKDLTLSLTASNLTNQAPDRFVGDPDNGYDTDILRQGFMNGRNYGLTLRYKFGG